MRVTKWRGWRSDIPLEVRMHGLRQRTVQRRWKRAHRHASLHPWPQVLSSTAAGPIWSKFPIGPRITTSATRQQGL